MVRQGKVSRALGSHGEQLAAEYLQAQGMEILERNWRCAEGELDIIAYDAPADALVFVEVKTKSGPGFGHPLEAITVAKARRLYRLALLWVDDRRRRARVLRVDGVGVLFGGQVPEITHVRGIAA